MKAFDKVSHKRLVKILKYYSLPLKVIDWIKSFLTNRKQRVLVNGIASGWHDVISGVPQGSVLGPILFVIYINTLVDVVQHSDLFLFADDNKLFKIIFNDEDTVLLQKDIDSMFSWTLNSLLLFHPNKCFTMHISSKLNETITHAYTMNNRILENKSELKDLGILIDEHLKFSNHIAEKVNKANQIMGLIRRTFVHLDMYNFNLLYKSLVRPHLEYGNIIWSPFLKSDINLLENTQRRATRFIPNINKLSYHERLEKLDLPTLSYRRFRGSMIETFKILHGYYDDNCVSSLFTFKSRITRGHKLSLRTRQCKTNVRRNFFTVRVTNLWNSLLGYVVKSPSDNSFQNRLNKYCRSKGIMFSTDIEFVDIYTLPVLLKSDKV